MPTIALVSRRALLVIAAIFAIASQASRAEVLELVPSSSWQMHYADDSCRLARSFGKDRTLITLILDQFSPSGGLDVTLTGEPVRHFGEFSRSGSAGFEPGLKAGDFDTILRGTNPDKVPAIALGRMEITGQTAGPRIPPSNDELGAIRRFYLEQSGRAIALKTGPMSAPLGAMRKCTADLVRLWGLEPDEQDALANLPVPTRPPGSWLKSSDYPSGALSMGRSAIVYFRLLVDKAGMPTACAIQRATKSPEFTDLTCKLLIARARFEPAHDRNGHAVASYYVDSVRWISG